MMEYKIWKEGISRKAVIPLGVRMNEKWAPTWNKKGYVMMKSSEKDNAFKQYVHALSLKFRKDINPIQRWAKGKRFLGKNVVMFITIFEDSFRTDIDAREKSIMDAMSGIMYENDRQVWRKVTENLIDKENPRVEISCIEERCRYD